MVFLWPNRTIYTTIQPRQPAFFTSALVKSLPPSSLVVIGPDPNPLRPTGMLWQANAGMRFRIMSGYAVPWPDDYPQDPADQVIMDYELGRAVSPSVTPASIRAELVQQRISAVVLGPGTANLTAVVSVFSAAIGRPPLVTGGVTAWLLAGSHGAPAV